MNQTIKVVIKKSFIFRFLRTPLFWLHQISSKKKLEKTFENEYNAFVALSKKSNQRFLLNPKDQFPCLFDKTTFTDYDRHYVLHPVWAAGVLKKIAPSEHVDISSILYFSTLMSNFFKIRFFDYRPAKINIPNFESQYADLMNLHFETGSVKSLSCMHTLEHIGLGRYGDALDYDGE